jgi:hypothetical protein
MENKSKITPRAALVGESNPYGSNPRYALFYDPPESAGGRLCRLVMGLEPRQYLRDYARFNLCDGKWSLPKARDRADRLNHWEVDGQVPFVLLGAKVCSAFAIEFKPFAYHAAEVYGRPFVILPHPSGRCRLWDESGAMGNAREVLAAAGVIDANLVTQ